jgi:hypothetical protein
VEFRPSTSLLNSVSDRTAAERIFNFLSRISWNSGTPEYRFGWQLSQLSDGPSNGSKRLTICELRQSETRPVAESAFPADDTFLYKTSFWWNFAMTTPETSYMKNIAHKLSFLLVTHTTHFGVRFGRYVALNFCFSSGHVVDRLDCRIWSGFWSTRWVSLTIVWIPFLEDSKSAFRCLLKDTFSITIATVRAI